MSIDITNIHKNFGTFAALRDVSFSVPDGELVALLGPSGSGKTTLLRIIAGLESADAGTVHFNGEDVSNVHVGQRSFGFVFQHYALFRHMTVAENIAFGLTVRPRGQRPSRAQIRAKVDELLHLVQLQGMEHRYPSQLSGGQRQRVALARTLAIEPKVLLLDEPFGALDAKVRQSLRQWLRKLHDEIHVTSIFVTHDQEEALELADRVVVMNKGKVEQVGTPDEVFHHSANPFVMNFLGNVNLFHGRIEAGKAIFGSLVLDHNGHAGETCNAKLFIRPHNMEILKQSDGASSISAQVLRILSAGPLVKIEMVTENRDFASAEIGHEEFRAKQIAVGDRIFVSPRNGRIFAADYAI